MQSLLGVHVITIIVLSTVLHEQSDLHSLLTK